MTSQRQMALPHLYRNIFVNIMTAGSFYKSFIFMKIFGNLYLER